MYYEGICSEKGKFVDKAKAFDYALEKIKNGSEEEKADFVEWFFSGNWLEREGELDI